MILEAAILNVRPGQEAAFESAIRAAKPLIAATGVLSISTCSAASSGRAITFC